MTVMGSTAADGRREIAVVAASVCVAFAAIGAMFLYMDLSLLAAVIGLPGWIGVLGLIGGRLPGRLSLPLALGLASINDQLFALNPLVNSSQRLVMAAVTVGAWATGWGWRQWRAMATERRQHNAALQWQQSLYNLMLNSTTECVKLIRPDGTLLAINAAGVQLLGASTPEALVGHNWFEMWGPATAAARAACTEALTNGVSMFEAAGPTLRGDMRQWRNRISAVQVPGGERQLLCVSSDISAAAAAEQTLASQIVQQQQLLESLPLPAFTADTDGRITFANVRAAALMQLDAALPARATFLREQLPAATVQALEESLQQALVSGLPQHYQFYWPQRLAWLSAALIPNGAAAVTVVLNDLSSALVASAGQLEIEQRRLVRDISGVGDWLFNYREGLLILSESALAVLGLPPKTPLQGTAEGGHKMVALSVLHPDDRVPLVQAIIHAATHTEPLQLNVRRLDALAPGGARYLSWLGRSVVDPIEGVPRLLGAVRDVTHERILGDQSERWRRLFSDSLDALPLDILVIDSEGFIVAVNRSYRESQRAGLGNIRLQVDIGANYLEVFVQSIQADPDHRSQTLARTYFEGVRAVLRGERPAFEFEYAGAGRNYRVRYAPIEGTNLIVSAHADVTATKKLTSTLVEHDRRLAQAMNATQDGVWVWAPATGKTFYSSQFGELVQYRVADLPAFDAMLLTTTHPEDHARVQVQLAEFNPPVDRHTFSLEVRLLVASSSYRWFRLRGEVQRDARGEVEIVGSIMDIQAERDLQQKIYDVAFRDEITHLPNRQAFYQRLEQVCAEPEPEFALLLVDLDRFKNVNSSLGVVVGDDLLRQVAERLPRALGPAAYIARLSGDEFAVLLPRPGAREQLEQQLDRIIAGMRPAFTLDGQDMFITATIGVALCPQDGRAAEHLLRAVDVALRGAKTSGRNSFRFFESSLQLPGRERLVLETQLRQALERDEFELFYQGKFDLRTDELIGAEALLRWRSHEHGLVSPAEFIPLLEETGLILAVGEWALRDACRQVSAWHRQTGRWLRVAVNVSTIQMAAHDFGDTAIAILRESHIPAQTIELEITESALMADIEQGAQLLKVLKLAGFSIALDDFGTGYSSLGYLRRFSPHTLKMDRSFMADLEHDISAREIAAGIVQLARALSIDVVAEGIESKVQRDILRGMRCPIGQGYLFAKPISVPEFEQRLFAVNAPRVAKLDKR